MNQEQREEFFSRIDKHSEVLGKRVRRRAAELAKQQPGLEDVHQPVGDWEKMNGDDDLEEGECIDPDTDEVVDCDDLDGDGFGKFVKVDADKQLVYGWASVISEKGQPVADGEGDIITPGELVKAAHAFLVEAQGNAGLMHVMTKNVGRVVESVVLTHDVQKAMGIDLGREGWFICVKVESPAIWKLVKNGTLRAFSIGGLGRRAAVPDEPYWKRDFSSKQRDKLADSGHAMKDGSFPIVSRSDLKNAIQAVGRAKDYNAAKRHITSRAKEEGWTDDLPEDWSGSSSD